MSDPAFEVIAHLIGLSVAPVFLLVAVASFLNVATQRLARVVDRARAIEDRSLRQNFADDHANTPSEFPAPISSTAPIQATEGTDYSQVELAALDRRISYANASIMISSVAALLVAIDVAILFIGGLTGANIAVPVAVLFILAMGCVITGLGFFLAEISVATRTLRVRSGALRR